ncbi:hypothetical protein TspCOW1_10710 [Thiohalobacter sp. COW1]|uniref:Uncharacterized protein n=1 Tax=Thiohalobacter thiocyanaticus TaxID=585455 RepID=A0A1Z4VRY6_9GAMM|nr:MULTISPECIES: hypothetical protein [Thiohalobacter]BAZ93964.1 uncharacterized protein FOKN1_1569 [Thiohalobacter thiocyanaticus]BCO30968.1 hypothetical protein TspCOW1_10710 [Thiohalobacter sp. COW1]
MKRTVFLCGMLAGLLWQLPAGAGTTHNATILHYQESEQGIAPYPVRILVTPAFLRLDDGEDGGNFLLVDRAAGVLHNVNHQSRNILTIADSEITAVEGSPQIEVRVRKDAEAPSIGGESVSRVDVIADNELCMTAHVVPALLPDVTAALRQYQQILAARQFRDLELTPESMRSPCFYANYVHGATRYLDEGLPVQWAHEGGRTQVLVNYEQDRTVPASLFTLPEDYQRVELE